MRSLFKHLNFWDWGMVLASVVLVLIKIPFLDLPFFWDEAWVYAPAVFDMYENGPSLLPDSINPLFSRGHPILFHFFAVCWMTVFGTSFTAVHAFSLMLAVATLWAVYRLGTELATKQVGFWAAVLLALQPMFIQQSGFLLPEIQLTLFVVLTVLFYMQRRIWPFVLAGSGLLLTKETGILLIAVIGILELVVFIRERNFSRQRLLELVSVGLPVVVAFGYFLIQYFQFGWFMFPEHVSMFDTDPATWEHKRDLVYGCVFLEQERDILIHLGLVVASLGWSRGPKVLRVLYLMCWLTVMTMTRLDSWLPGWYYEYVFPAVIAVMMVWTGMTMTKAGTKRELFFPIVGLLTPLMLFFTSAHFVIGRYLLFVIALVLVAIVVLVHHALKREGWLFTVAMVCVGLMFYHLVNKADARMTNQANMQYVKQIQVLQEGIDFMRQEGSFAHCITGSFLVQQALWHPLQGYITVEEKPRCVNNAIFDDTQYVMLLSYEVDGGLEPVRQDPSFEKVFETQRGAFRSWVFRRK